MVGCLWHTNYMRNEQAPLMGFRVVGYDTEDEWGEPIKQEA